MDEVEEFLTGVRPAPASNRVLATVLLTVDQLGIKLRAGLHIGEIELMEQDIGGIAVHLAARVVGIAQPDEVLVSSTVKELVAGSGIVFSPRGTHQLKGIPGEWPLFAAS